MSCQLLVGWPYDKGCPYPAAPLLSRLAPSLIKSARAKLPNTLSQNMQAMSHRLFVDTLDEVSNTKIVNVFPRKWKFLPTSATKGRAKENDKGTLQGEEAGGCVF